MSVTSVFEPASSKEIEAVVATKSSGTEAMNNTLLKGMVSCCYCCCLVIILYICLYIANDGCGQAVLPTSNVC